MNILIVENDPLVAGFLRKILKNIPSVHLVEIALDFHTAFGRACSNIFDIILIDILLGDKEFDGIELCRSIRRSNQSTPLIMITSCHAIEYLESAFEAGANEYITKPFRPKELVSRVKRWFSLGVHTEFQEQISYRDIAYNPRRHEFHYRGQKLELSRKQKTLFLLFLKNPERLLSSTFLREKFWGDTLFLGKNRNLRSNIHILRNALAPFKGIRIQTVHGEGYMLQHVEVEKTRYQNA